jgi:hypothetical protein
VSDQPTLLDVPATEPAHVVDVWPEWFTPGSTTPATHKARVRKGLHPLGGRLSASTSATCGNCAHLRRVTTRSGKTFNKCAMGTATAGPATDLRLGWRGCSWWAAPAEVSE